MLSKNYPEREGLISGIKLLTFRVNTAVCREDGTLKNMVCKPDRWEMHVQWRGVALSSGLHNPKHSFFGVFSPSFRS